MLQALPFGVGTTVLTVSTTDCIGSMMAPLVQDYRIRVVVSTPALLLCTLTGTISSVPGTSGDMVIYMIEAGILTTYPYHEILGKRNW